MRISSIVISNHQRVADLQIDVRHHAVLVGPNAAGKSTVLRLLDGLLGASLSRGDGGRGCRIRSARDAERTLVTVDTEVFPQRGWRHPIPTMSQ